MNIFLWDSASKERNKISAKYEPLQPFLFLSFLEFSGAEIVLDIGANIGLYSIISTIPSQVHTVYAFEPDEAAFLALKNNIHLNSLNNKIHPLQLAVSNTNTSVRFGFHTPMAGVNGVIDTSIHNPELFTSVHDVAATRLDDIKELKAKVLALKIDVEGHELQVIDGAQKLLQDNPTIIQIEHYTGSKAHEKLEDMGYFCFFSAGPDYYFTNISNFSNPLFVKRALEYASSWFIEGHAGRWPSINAITQSLSAKYKIDNEKIYTQAILKPNFFIEPEFAFYLLVDGVKIEEKWYQPDPKTVFDHPKEGALIEIKSFVREKQSPEKKISSVNTIKSSPLGFQQSSVVYNSLGLPSQYVDLVSSRLSFNKNHYEIDFSPLKQQLKEDKTAIELILIDNNWDDVLKKHLPISRTKIHKINNSNNIENEIPYIKNNSSKYLIFLGLVNSHLKNSFFILEKILKNCSKESILYAEALSNISCKNEITTLANRYEVLIIWLYPKSRIITHNNNPTSCYDDPAPLSQLENSPTSNLTTRLDFDFSITKTSEIG